MVAEAFTEPRNYIFGGIDVLNKAGSKFQEFITPGSKDGNNAVSNEGLPEEKPVKEYSPEEISQTVGEASVGPGNLLNAGADILGKGIKSFKSKFKKKDPFANIPLKKA